MTRRLRLIFADARSLREVYARDLALGGAFVPTPEVFELREIVELAVEVASCGEPLVAEAEVVQRRGPDDPGGPGVAVHLLGDPAELRARVEGMLAASDAEAQESSLELPDSGLSPDAHGEAGIEIVLDDADEAFDPSMRELSGDEPEEPVVGSAVEGGCRAQPDDPLAEVSDRREAARAPARLRAHLQAGSISLEGFSRDLSQTGVLVSADASALPEGSAVRVDLSESGSGESVRVEGTIARHLHVDGTPVAVAIRFDPDAASAECLADFVARVKELHVERILSGISGVIEELGMPNLLEMLSKSSPAGTLTVVRGPEHGVVAFERGLLRYVRLAGLRGEKALARLVSWEQGRFSFHAHVEPLEEEDPPTSVEAALLDALRRLDEARRAHWAPPAPTATFRVDREAPAGHPGASKASQAVLELAAAGFTLRRMLDVIPESDADILAALRDLEESGVLVRDPDGAS